MKKTIEISIEALAIYNNWGHKKSEKVSQAIIEKHEREQSGGYVTLEQHNRDIAELQRQIDDMKEV